MAEIRDELLLDIRRALASVDELERKINAASDATVDLDIASARRALGSLEDETIKVSVDSEGAAAELRSLNSQAENLGGSFSDLDEGLGDTTASLRGFSAAGAGAFSTLRGGIAGLAAGVAGLGLGKILGDAISASSDLNESLNAVRVTFGDAGDEILDLGETSAQAFGLSQAAFNQFATRFSAFAKTIAGEGGDVASVVDDITTRIADFASVHNLALEEAAVVAQSTLAGETESFRRFGGDVSAARVEAKALELGLADLNGEFTESDNVVARYSLFMEQTAATAGHFANTSDELANSQRILNAELTNSLALLGDAFIPLLGQLIAIADPAVDALSLVATQVSKLTGALDEGSAAIQSFEVLTGMNAESAGFVLGVLNRQVTGLDSVLNDLDDQIHTSAEETGQFAGFLREVLDAADLSREELVKLRGATDEYLESLGFTSEQIEIFRDALAVDIVSAARVAGDAARHAAAGFGEIARSSSDLIDPEIAMDNLARAAERLGVSLGDIISAPTDFPELATELAALPQVTKDLIVAADEVFGFATTFRDATDLLSEQVDIFSELPEALELSKEEFLANLRITAAEKAEFDANLIRLFIISPELAHAIEDQGISARTLLADLLTDPGAIAEAEALLTGAATDLSGFTASEFSRLLASEDMSGLIEFLSQLSDESVVGAAVLGMIAEINAALAAADLEAPLRLVPIFPTLSADIGGGVLQGTGGVTPTVSQSFEITVVSTGDTATDAARVAQTVAAASRGGYGGFIE